MSIMTSTSRVPRWSSGQSRQSRRRVEHLLNRMDDQGAGPVLRQFDDAFQPQQPVAMLRPQQIEEHLDRAERQRTVMCERNGTHARIVAVIVVMMMMGMLASVRVIVPVCSFFAQPAPNVGGFRRRIIEPAFENGGMAGLAGRRIQQDSARIDAAEACAERGHRTIDPLTRSVFVTTMRSATATCLTASRWLSSVAVAIDGIDHRDDPIQPEGLHERGMRHDRLQDGRGIGKTGRLDDDALQALDAPRLQPVDKVGERIDKFPANRAAETPVGKLDHAIRSLLDEQMIDRHVAEFIDDHRRVGQSRVLQQAVEQGRLASAEKPGQHRYRNRKIDHAQPPACDALAVGLPVF